MESDSNSAKVQQQASLTTTQSSASNQKSSKETKGHKALGGLKKLIDRDKDKDSKDKEEKKEKEKGEKEFSKAASVIKSGLNDTKENMKKLIGKDKQSSKSSSLQQTSNHYDENQQTQQPLSHTNNGDLKNSPLVLMKRSSDVLSDNSGNIEVAMINEMKEVTNCNNNGNASHGIISPFDSLNSDSESEVEHPHHQLSTSSSASVNILMDNTNAKNLSNMQVSQV
ncbi:hypothetical protein PVAND_008223 [Polypedilum vanderplanki]|uniref:Uncharacterized protein n=1 Tax=Polypedilum vanderplanki TaxID=319348 RepID=A0A9J6CAB8_POLVA|nr:hypothetical protein PVAND_008223 [Polypedilum vanderplanki]